MTDTQALPLVSISCITYNQEAYIRACLDGFLMQRTNFRFEVLIHDDASTDNTASIIREYEARYPEIFKPICQTENQYSKGVNILAKFNFSRARGKYIAMCEGDDYWMDEHKLQDQVDYMEANPHCVISAHNAIQLNMRNGSMSLFNKHSIATQTNLHQYLAAGTWLVPTASTLFRTDAIPEIYAKHKFYNGDFFLQSLLLTTPGSYMHYSEKIMAVYRKHEGGVSASASTERWCNSLIQIYTLLNQYTGFKYDAVIGEQIQAKKAIIARSRSIGQYFRTKINRTLERFFHKRIENI